MLSGPSEIMIFPAGAGDYLETLQKMQFPAGSGVSTFWGPDALRG